jgi:hypothetical protein
MLGDSCLGAGRFLSLGAPIHCLGVSIRGITLRAVRWGCVLRIGPSSAMEDRFHPLLTTFGCLVMK